MRNYLLGILFLVNISFTIAQTATQPSGTGTAADPYLITSLNNLYWITQNEDKWGIFHFKQTANIDATNTNTWSWVDVNGNDAVGIKSIGDGDGSFFGTYDGQGYSISNLYIRRRIGDNIGLFGNTHQATIKNLNLTNANITSFYDGNEENVSYDYIGGLIGASIESNVINCSISGSVSGGFYVGGLVGYSYDDASIESCYSTCNVSGLSYVGGLCGINYSSIVDESYSTGIVTASGTASVDGYYSGGLIGRSDQYSEVNNCYSSGNASGTYYIGGLVGINTNQSYIENCYSTGSSSGSSSIGGLVGDNYDSEILNSFWDTETSNNTTSDGGTGKTTAEMQTGSTFTNAGWDFSVIWQMNGYPELQNNIPLPVELTSFTITAEGSRINLSWETATEVNNYGFNIERTSTPLSMTDNFISNGKDGWEKINFVEGHGNSNSPKLYNYIDTKISSGKYFYRLKQIDIDGSFEYSKIVEIDLGLPTEFELSQNFPNPFNPSTTIKYSIPNEETLHAMPVQLKVYDVLGKEITTLVNEEKEAGTYTIEFNAKNLPSGMYFYRLETSNFVRTIKMSLVK